MSSQHVAGIDPASCDALSVMSCVRPLTVMRRQPAADYAVIKLAPDEGMQLIADGHFTIEIGVFMRDETVDKGQCNRERQPSPLSICHDFDVFPNLGKDGLYRLH